LESDRREADVSEHDEQVQRGEEQPALEDRAKEAIRGAIEEGYQLPSRSESIGQELLAAVEGDEAQAGEAYQRLDLNTATEKELGKLPGIGPALASRIVRYREEDGPFREAAEITKVRGISLAMFQALADKIVAGPVEGKTGAEVAVEEAEEVEETPVPAAEAALPPSEEAAEEEGETVGVPKAADVDTPPLPPIEPPPPAAQWMQGARPATRRGVGWGGLLVVGLLSTLLGALLALLVLFLLNGGTLDFQRATARAIDREVSQLEGQLSELQTQLDEVRQRLGGLEELARRLDETQTALEGAQADIGALQERAGSLQGELDVTSQALAGMRQTLAGLSDDLTSVAESVTALDEQVTTLDARLAELDDQVVTLRRAAARFDAFLLGLRQLLEENVQGPASPQPGEATPAPARRLTPAPTPIELTPTPASQVTVIPLVTPTP
jgi:competence ComEA-like helix-hairpin-helix protein